MKLSDAIRKGCEGTKQVKEAMFGPDYRSACALGAAYLGRFGDPKEFDGDYLIRLKEAYREAFRTPHEDPTEFGETNRLDVLMMRLNDRDNWTREEIAEWVESLGF